MPLVGDDHDETDQVHWRTGSGSSWTSSPTIVYQEPAYSHRKCGQCSAGAVEAENEGGDKEDSEERWPTENPQRVACAMQCALDNCHIAAQPFASDPSCSPLNHRSPSALPRNFSHPSPRLQSPLFVLSGDVVSPAHNRVSNDCFASSTSADPDSPTRTETVTLSSSPPRFIVPLTRR
ncbi:hypothetical protein CYLTODRAFT_114395 [Cylindrobasidium torrendii FP15055 ss-10]|uniref:Uncharacterized protein n=1 Tax=Cylindrobasidium torrendii FP15055 ss-10 TaxID=1314674 RepID=A0A0D7B0B9_9AGAR|nr:hypothetical protein CYLTODRAFT_114395 [Cylindrobasidium torrendii FP15055 ss-10]